MRSTKLALGLLIVTLVGCNQITSETGAVYLAYESLRKNDTKNFLRTLQPGSPAEMRYGNPEGMKILQEKLAPYPSPILGKSSVIKSEEFDKYGTTREVHLVTVEGRTDFESWRFTKIFEVEVECFRYIDPPRMGPYQPGHPFYRDDPYYRHYPRHGTHHGDPNIPPSSIQYVECKITDIH